MGQLCGTVGYMHDNGLSINTFKLEFKKKYLLDYHPATMCFWRRLQVTGLIYLLSTSSCMCTNMTTIDN